MALLEVKDLARSFGSLRAVDNVSFTLEAGKILGFIGPNGAGKSTTLRMLATLDTPTAGEIRLDGVSVVEAPDKARPLIGYMPDRYGTYDDMTVFEFLDFFARAYGLKGQARKKRVESVMDFTGLTSMATRLTPQLSKGMKQRVALGRTLLHDPKLLLLDEPADGLDPRARIELRELLRALAAQGKAVLISSHILTELSEICDSCAIIEQGRLLVTGSVAEVTSKSEGEAPGCEVVLRLLSADADAERRAERLLLTLPEVAKVQPGEKGGLRLRLAAPENAGPTWAEESSARVLRALVQADVPVCGFQLKEADLEDAFMRVTRGRVA
ncbi:MAG TPA: ABC transporter ATP-binding protein [Myxococcaceae bacterium]|nr:ABC transporter ATP-binding protein [Myxococcaceae bacterium]